MSFDIRSYRISNNYVLNKNFGGEPYVHKYANSYREILASGSATAKNMEDEALKIYMGQANKVDSRFRRQQMLTAENADKALETMDKVFEGLTSSAALERAVKEVSAFQKDKFKIDGKSLSAYSQFGSNREKLFQDAEKMDKYVKYLNQALDLTFKMDDKQKQAISMMMGDDVIPDKEHFRNLTIIGTDKKADTSLKKLVAAVEQLNKYSKQQKTGVSMGISDSDADEIIRGLAGSINGLQGGLFEVALPKVINNGRNKIIRELKAIGITMTAQEAGASTVASSSTNRMVVSKSDTKVVVSIDELEATMEIGLNLKTTKKKKGGIGVDKVSTFVGKANLKDLLTRAGSINSDTVYHIANTSIHALSTQSAIYSAAKNKMAALLAVEALTGLGNASDSALYIIYTNKAIRISTFLRQMAAGTMKLNVNLHGVKSVTPLNDMSLDRYVRSHNELNHVLSNVKVSITG